MTRKSQWLKPRVHHHAHRNRAKPTSRRALSVTPGPGAQCDCRRGLRDSRDRLHSVSDAQVRVAVLDFAGFACRLSRESDPPGHLPQPLHQALGRTDRQHSVLGAARRRRDVHGLRDKLHASGMPGALVPRIGTVHVPLPRRRFLCQRRATRRVRRRAPFTGIITKSRTASFGSTPAKCRLSASPWPETDGRRRTCAMSLMQRLKEVDAGVGAWLDHRLQLSGTIAETADASGAAQFRELVVRLRQRHLHRTDSPVRHRTVPGDGLCADCRQSLAKPDLSELRPAAGMVYLRALHGWGSNFMVGLVCIHMAQVFLFGAHKYPRELTWIAGVVLLLGTLGMAFTGQVLRFDQNAYWGLGIGAAIAGRTPFIGAQGRRHDSGRPDNRRRDACRAFLPCTFS